MEVQNQQNPSHDHHLISNSSSSFKQSDVVVIMVPFPSQSHLNQLLQLSCLISTDYNIPVHYVGWATHINQAKHRFNATNHLGIANIHFHDFPTPPFSSPPPNPNSSSKFPSHLQPSFESSLQLRRPIAALLQKISPTARRVIVIHDFLTAYAIQDITAIPNAECYTSIPLSAFHYFFNVWQRNGKPFLNFEEPEGLPSREGCFTPEMVNFVKLQSEFVKLRAGTIFNSCRSIEDTYFDLLAKDVSRYKQIWAIGPLNLRTVHDESRSSNTQHKCLEWLDKQAPKSVLYVSFGTTTSLTDEQIKELAMGLEQSEQRFIWVLRDADKGDIFEDDVKRAELPEGYEERVKEVGMVVRDWAPQLEILGHPSTGGFMSHCGWNSCLESISMGVPVAAWPMHSDQPKNAFLVTNIFKVGLAVNQWAQREELVTSSTIAKVVKRLIASEEGEEMRKRTEELGGVIQLSVKEGGVSRMELDSFIAHVSRIVSTSKSIRRVRCGGGGNTFDLKYESKNCHCGVRATIRVTKSTPNKGRLYFVCERKELLELV